MKIVIAMDSFKGSMTSMEAGQAAAEGFRRAGSTVETDVYPMADGGEGTTAALIIGMHGLKEKVTVTGPLGQPTEAAYGIIPESRTAIIEMAAAAGITLIPREKLDLLSSTTYGVGEMIMDAVDKGCRRFIIGIGGSATNDGGIGMLSAMGIDFTDAAGKQVPLGGKGLKMLERISGENMRPELRECTFRIACDVMNPLCGPEGCSKVFGPQKGASPEAAVEMDEWMTKYASIAKEFEPAADPQMPGAGAAGGLGFAFLAFTDAKLESGVKLIIEETGLEKAIKEADIVVTGEGRLDEQTVMGKAPAGVARIAKKYGRPVIAFAGSIKEEASLCNKSGIDCYFPIVRGVTTFEEAMDPENAKRNLAAAAEQVMRLLNNILKRGSYENHNT